ncbi:hypothetical protein CSC70_06170 [Pseudoxanthomonas kalamensis DSM 18571]|nr:hypothetical protein CSC70_06170 [Pseudoxanthomonas kalamensis DSM 18571]
MQHPNAAQSVQLAIARAGDKRLVSVGERGIVLLSDDDGRTWKQAASVPVSVALTNVFFVSDKIGWATGHSGVILRSDDGGDTWRLQLTGSQAATLVLEEARARMQGTTEAAGEDALPEGSTSPTPADVEASRALSNAERLVEEGPDKPFLALAFVDEKHGWVVGAYGLALETRDGGMHWRSIVGRIPNPGGRHLYAIRSGAADVLLVGEQGLVIRSDDGGESFSAVDTPYEGTFFGVVQGVSGPLAYGLRGNAWEQDGEGDWHQIQLPRQISLTAAVRKADGHLVLADEAGNLYTRASPTGAFLASALQAPTGLTGIVESRDGELVATSTRGPLRLANGVVK